MLREILIVEDNRKLCESLARSFEIRNIQTLFSFSSQDALRTFTSENIHVVLLDLRLGEEDGMDVLRQLLKIRPAAKIIIITAYGTIENAVQAIREGAYDYIQKPIKFEKLLRVVINAFESVELSGENSRLRRMVVSRSANIITQNSAMNELLEKAQKVAATNIPVLITGESGTGKELLAEFIHLNSEFSGNEMNKINCTSFPDTLLDNELFGHEKGAFTGATSTYPGVFERANNSTLFLDEIGDMPASVQAKMLRALQDSEIRRLGGTRTIRTNVRFIAATNKDLTELVERQTFRADLLFRINTAVFQLPPLRARTGDIPLLAEHFVRTFTGDGAVKKVSDKLLDLFSSYEWPGNIRELRNVLYYASAIDQDGIIDVNDLPNALLSRNLFREKLAAAGSDGGTSVDIGRRSIETALELAEFNRTKAARLLGVSRATLYNKMREYGLSIKYHF